MVASSLVRPERLRYYKHIRCLLRKGKRQDYAYFCVYYLWTSDLALPLPDAPAQVFFAVPKRVMPKAVHRHRIQRRLRHAYRRHKKSLQVLANPKKFLLIGYRYTKPQIAPYADLDKDVKNSIERIFKTITTHLK